MEGKLIKEVFGGQSCYTLFKGDDKTPFAKNGKGHGYMSLSFKNCEAIANGYDLDELASERLLTRFDENSGYHKFVFVEAYKEGFQKAMELLGDKKFSEDDILKAIEMYYGKDKIFIEIIQSLQQTEFDVEIVTKPYTEVSEGFELESKREPKLDKDGCLILKRI